MDYTMLINAALGARNNSYCPYSKYAVGAALLAVSPDGRETVITGCNVENSSYGATNCAERTAIFKAVSEGMVDFKAIVITGGHKGEAPADFAYPCGVCRQVMSEFCNGDFKIIVARSIADYKVFTLSELLPMAFDSDKIN